MNSHCDLSGVLLLLLFMPRVFILARKQCPSSPKAPDGTWGKAEFLKQSYHAKYNNCDNASLIKDADQIALLLFFTSFLWGTGKYYYHSCSVIDHSISALQTFVLPEVALFQIEKLNWNLMPPEKKCIWYALALADVSVVLPDRLQSFHHVTPCQRNKRRICEKENLLNLFGQNVDWIHVKVSSGNRRVCKASFPAPAAASTQEIG